MLERSIEGSSEEDVAASGILGMGRTIMGEKKRRGGGRADRELPVSDEKSGRRFSVPTLPGSVETKRVRLRVKARMRTNCLVDQ